MNAKEILECWNELDGDFGPQKGEDDRMAQLLQRKAAVQSGQKVDPNNPVKRVGMGHPGLAVNQMYSLITRPPYIRVNSPKQSQDKHAEDLENGLLGLWQMATGSVPVWNKSTYDYTWSGRGITKTCYYPQMWGGDRYKPGEYEAETDIKSDNDRIMRLKEANVPILIKYVDPRNCRRTKTITGDTDIVVEKLKLRVRAAKLAYPEVNFGDMTDREEVEIIHYADWKKLQTIVVGKEPQSTSYDFDHNLGMNPYNYMVAPMTAPEDEVEFRGVLYHTKDLFDAEEQIFSDAIHNFRQSVANAWKVKKDLGYQNDGIDPAGMTRKIEYKPGGIIDNLEPGEDFLPVEAARTNIDGQWLLNVVGSTINSTAIQPVLFGALQSGQSGTLFNTAAQFAQNQYGPATEQLERGAKDIAKRLFKCVEMFGEDIPIYYTKADGTAYSLTLRPKDVQGWEHRIQARIDLSIPQNENAQMELYRLAVDPTNPLLPWEDAYSRYGGGENPVEAWERIVNNQVERAMVADIIQLTRMNFLAELQNVSPELQQRISNLPFAAQQAIQLFTSNSGGSGQIARTNANTVRAGQAENLGVPRNGY